MQRMAPLYYITMLQTGYRRLSVYGPNAFPVITDNDGYAYVVAGKFGKVSSVS